LTLNTQQRGQARKVTCRQCSRLQIFSQFAGHLINLNFRTRGEVFFLETACGDSRVLPIVRVGETGMRLNTIDTDPKSGKSVVTSRINLRRT
jgi:hypothetical protein